MSGAGKSYFISVLLEELLSRKKAQGRLSVVVVDVHGEYSYLKDIKPEDLGLPDNEFEVEHIRGSHIQIPVQSLAAETIGSLVADMSSIQVRDLRRVISEMRSTMKSGYTLTDTSYSPLCLRAWCQRRDYRTYHRPLFNNQHPSQCLFRSVG